MIKILNIEAKNCFPEVKAALSSFAEITDMEAKDGTELRKYVGEFDVILTRVSNKIDKELLEQAGSLKVIVTNTTGLDHIDLEAAKELNISVLSLKGETEFLKTISATAELTWGLLLALQRKLYSAFNDVLEGNWRRDLFIGGELSGKILGVIGYGRLGKMVASYGRTFNMKVCAYDPYQSDHDVRWVSFDELLDESDVVTLHVPLNDETKKMMNKERLFSMKKGALLINTSRGEIIDEEGLLDALENEHLGGAALDVMVGEDKFRSGERGWPVKDSLVKYAASHTNLIITPHIGGMSNDSIRKTDLFMVKRLKEFLIKEGLLQ